MIFGSAETGGLRPRTIREESMVKAGTSIAAQGRTTGKLPANRAFRNISDKEEFEDDYNRVDDPGCDPRILGQWMP